MRRAQAALLLLLLLVPLAAAHGERFDLTPVAVVGFGTAAEAWGPVRLGEAAAASHEEPRRAASEASGDDVAPTLRLGLWVPLSGELAWIGQDQREAARLAVEEFDAAQGDLEVVLVEEDDRSTDRIGAPGDFERMRAQGATAILGPACSCLLREVIDRAIAERTVVVSPSSTEPDLSEGRDNDGFIVRMSPHEGQTWRALAALAARDGMGSAVVFEASTGEPWAAPAFDAAFEGPTTVLRGKPSSVCAHASDAIVIVGDAEHVAEAFGWMLDAGCTEGRRVYVSREAEGFPFLLTEPSRAAGVRGLRFAAEVHPDFVARFEARTGAPPAVWSAQAYDAAAVILLAASQAGSNDGTAIRDRLLLVLNGPADGSGVSCGSVARCAELVAQGIAIDYAPVVFDEPFHPRGDPETAAFTPWEVDAKGDALVSGPTIRP